MSARGQGVDFLLTDEESDVVTTSLEHFTHGNTGEEMTTGATARDQDLERRNLCFSHVKLRLSYDGGAVAASLSSTRNSIGGEC